MRRRALLAALSATAFASATAGCSMFESKDRPRDSFAVTDTTTEQTTSMTFEHPPNDVARGFTVPGDDDHDVAITTPRGVPDDLAVTLGFTDGPTSDSPATVFVELARRESADGPVDLPAGPTPPMSAYEGVHESADGQSRRLFLVPRRAGAGFDDLVRRDRGCWRPKLPVGPRERSASATTLEPGESVAREYYLVTPWANDRCLMPGRYRFSTEAGWSFHVCPFDVEPPRDSQYADLDVPRLPGFPGTYWYHEAVPAVYVEPHTEQVGLPSATVRLKFRNQSHRVLTVDRAAWALYKLVDDTWYPIAPHEGRTEQVRVLPGETVDLALSLFTEPDAPSENDRRAIGGLGQGRYAVAFPASVQTTSIDGIHRPGGPPAALVTVVGNRPPLEATGAIDHTERRDATVHAFTTPDESSVATLRVERTGSNPTSQIQRLLLEQVLQRDALRDAIVTLRDAGSNVDTVVYHTDATSIERVTAWIDRDGDGIEFAFQGTTYATSYG